MAADSGMLPAQCGVRQRLSGAKKPAKDRRLATVAGSARVAASLEGAGATAAASALTEMETAASPVRM